MTTRWLTPEAKVAEVTRWLDYRSSVEIPENAGGRGYPDPIMFAWTDRINEIPYVCTLQSCSGHRVPNGDGGTFFHAGQLWLWLTQRAAREAYDWLPDLESLEGIETVRINMIDGREILDVIFAGGESDSDLRAPLTRLIAWLQRLVA